jgi:hypothetical protein
MASNSDVLKSIEDSKKHLAEVLSQVTPDDTLISGILNFVRSKFLNLIITDTNESLNRAAPTGEEDLKLNQNQENKPKSDTAEYLIDKVWNDFYHPVFKYYQLQQQRLCEGEGQHRKRIVELRKVNDRFKKIAKQSRDFFFDLLKNVLTQHKIDFIVPQYFYDSMNLSMNPNAIKVNPQDNITVVKLIYLAHKCMLFIGATSRYRSLLSKDLSPADHEKYTPAFQMYRSAELLLPAFGDTNNYLGMAYNDQDLKFSALYEFLRASLSRIPSSLGQGNYRKMINSTSTIIDQLNKFRLEVKHPGKIRHEVTSVYFFALFGYYSVPSTWKRSENYLINGTKVSDLEKDLFNIISEIVREGESKTLLEKIFISLIGSIKLSNSSRSVTPELNKLLKFTFKFITYMQVLFVELWYDTQDKSLKLLPLLRLVYSWIKVDKLAFQYSNRSFEFLRLSAVISNLLFDKYPNEKFRSRPQRDQFFSEDVLVREFTPLDRLLYDFNDTALFEGNDSPAKLIGKYTEHDSEQEDKLRSIAVGTIVKKILESNQFGIIFDEKTRHFDLGNAKPPPLKKAEPKQQKIVSEAKAPKASRAPARSKSNNRKESKQSNRNASSKTNSVRSNDITERKPDIPQQVYPKLDSSLVSSSPGSSVELTQAPPIEKLIIGDNSPRPQSTVPILPALNAEDLEARLTGTGNVSTIVDSLVTNTFSTSNQNIWKSTPQSENWGMEGPISYPQFGNPNGFSQPFPNTSVNPSNVYSPPVPGVGYLQYLSSPPVPHHPQQQQAQQNMYLQYLNHYQQTTQPPLKQNPQHYEYNNNIQVPGTQSPSPFPGGNQHYNRN